MKNSFLVMVASGFLLSLSWTGVCVLQAQQSGSTIAEETPKFQPQLVTKTVNVFNPPARGSATVTLKGTDLAPGASGQAKLKMGDVEVKIEAQADGLRPPSSLGSQFETYVVWAITPQQERRFDWEPWRPRGAGSSWIRNLPCAASRSW